MCRNSTFCLTIVPTSPLGTTFLIAQLNIVKKHLSDQAIGCPAIFLTCSLKKTNEFVLLSYVIGNCN